MFKKNDKLDFPLNFPHFFFLIILYFILIIINFFKKKLFYINISFNKFDQYNFSLTNYQIIETIYQYSFDYYSPKNLKKCSICNFLPKNYFSTSISKDIIITIMINSYTNLIACIKSLRTTGCKASFFIFTDDNTIKNIPLKLLNFLNNCKCFLINIKEFPNLSSREFWGFRYLLIQKFLVSHQYNINRVLIIDLFDTIFQGDPFTNLIDKNFIYFSSEFQSISKCYINYDWIKTIDPINYLNFANKTIINGGTIIGGLYPILKFLNIFFSLFNPNDLSSMIIDDQGYINYLIYSNFLKNINFLIDISGEILVSLNKVLVWQRIPNDYTIGNFQFKSNLKFPSIIHQYKFDKACRNSLIKYCYSKDLDFPNFLPNVENKYLV